MKYDLQQKIKDIKRSGAYTLEQIGVIEYAIYRPELSVDSVMLIINPSIPSEYMSMYVRLMIKGIDVKKYIRNNWELIDIPVFDLEKTIMAEYDNKKFMKNAMIFEVTSIENNRTTEEYPLLEKPKQKIRRK